MLPYMLMASQAAGIGMNMYAQRKAEKMTRIGEKLDLMGLQNQLQTGAMQFETAQLQLDTRMKEEQLAFTQQALFDTEKLREVMATQRALFSVRGQMGGVGTAAAISNKSVNAFNADERARNLSQLFAKNRISNQKSLLKIQKSAFDTGIGSQMIGLKVGQAGRKAQAGANLMMQGMNMFSFNSMGQSPFGANKYQKPGKGFSDNLF